MKRTSKIFAVVLAVATVLSMASAVFADTQYTVVKGDWLSKIAPRYNTTWQKLAEYNNLKNPDLIFPGQIIRIPDGSPESDEAQLTGLDVKDSTLKPIFSGFSAAKKSYAVSVQSDIYGVLVKATAPKGATVSVSADKDAKAYGGALTYKGGDAIAYDEAKGGYIVQLSQDYADYDSEFVQTVSIKVSQSGKKDSEYKVVVTRKCDSALYSLFKEGKYTDPENGAELPYLLYVPSDYDAGKKYPVVFALHGSGQRTQPLDMLLKRYRMATSFAEDSEKGHNQCIILAPQCTVKDANLENWTTLMSYRAGAGTDAYGSTDKLEAAYNLLLKIMDEYSVDRDRVYMHGLSAGGYASFTLATEYPETFAAIAPDAGGGRPSDMYKLAGMPIWIFQAEDDPTVPLSMGLDPTRKALDAAGVEYKLSLYKTGEVFYPSAHFSWVPMYADQEFKDWLFAQSRAENADVLTGLKVEDISMKPIFSGFDPATHTYTVNVQDDIYGVKLSPKAAEGAQITVNGEALSGGSYLLALPQGLDDYFSDVNKTAVIKVTDGDKTGTYSVNVVRKSVKDVYALFQEKSYKDAETGLTLPYELYVPSDYVSYKKYPVVLALHGAGQRTQPLYMLLARYQSATAWAVDSERGHNQCIVISPQVTKADGNGWTEFMKLYDNVAAEKDVKDPYALQPWGVAAYNLLHYIESQYSVDLSRVYATGLSMGGFGSYAMAAAHPTEFAAIVPTCGGLDLAKASVLKENNVAVWNWHAKDDPAVSFDKWGRTTLDALEKAGVEYRSTVFEPGEVFYPNAHFSWTPAYASQEMRDWLFSHSK